MRAVSPASYALEPEAALTPTLSQREREKYEMSDDPKISVLMSVYNGEKYLAPAMDSILAQSFRDFELIVIDDGSKDSSPNILRDYENATRA